MNPRPTAHPHKALGHKQPAWAAHTEQTHKLQAIKLTQAPMEGGA